MLIKLRLEPIDLEILNTFVIRTVAPDKNELFTKLIESIMEELRTKIAVKTLKIRQTNRKTTLSLKVYEAIALLTMYMDGHTDCCTEFERLNYKITMGKIHKQLL